jgi:hypothetical protein
MKLDARTLIVAAVLFGLGFLTAHLLPPAEARTTSMMKSPDGGAGAGAAGTADEGLGLSYAFGDNDPARRTGVLLLVRDNKIYSVNAFNRPNSPTDLHPTWVLR